MKGFAVLCIVLLASLALSGASLTSGADTQSRNKRNPPLIAQPALGLGLGYGPSLGLSSLAIASPIAAGYASSIGYSPLALRSPLYASSLGLSPLGVGHSLAHSPLAISTPVATPVIASPVLGLRAGYGSYSLGGHGLNSLAYGGLGLNTWNSPWNSARVLSPYTSGHLGHTLVSPHAAGFGSSYDGGWW